jgi:hypothetical protein
MGGGRGWWWWVGAGVSAEVGVGGGWVGGRGGGGEGDLLSRGLACLLLGDGLVDGLAATGAVSSGA